MSRKAVDIVLLPDETMTDTAVRANAGLVEKFGEKIVLNKKNCLPHISLAMGCVDEKDIAAIGNVLQKIAREFPPGDLRVVGLRAAVNSAGQNVSAFEVERTSTLQSLHEKVMAELAKYFGTDVTGDMINCPGPVGQSTLLWIKNYREKSSFANFWPHITIGYGQMSSFEINNLSLPIKFTASKLALCHLGNHCTCTRILVSTELKSV